MKTIDKWAQIIEAEKRKICLAKMKKEEETRGKARRNKEKVNNIIIKQLHI